MSIRSKALAFVALLAFLTPAYADDGINNPGAGGGGGGSSPCSAFGTSAGTCAQGNDSRITGALQSANNLSDLASASTARTNLGLGGLATVTPGTGVAAALANAAGGTGGFALQSSVGPCTSFGTASGTCAQGGVITAGGPTGSATVAPIITYNAAGQLTGVSSATITPAVGSITGLGTGVATALGNTAGGAGGFALQGGSAAAITVGTTTIGSGSTTNIEYNNAGVLGEYTISGTGTVVAMTASPTFTGTVNVAALTASGLLGTSSAGSALAPSLFVGNSTTGCYSISTTAFGCSVNGTSRWDFGATASATLTLNGNTNVLGNLVLSAAARGILTSPAAGSVQLGAGDAASPVAQTLRAQSVVAGNANTAAVTLTLQGSLSNGSGAGGNIVLATTQSTAASGTQNTALAALTLVGGTQFAAFAKAATFGSSTPAVGQGGDVAQIKETDAAAAPGAGYAVLKWVAGSGTSCNLIAYAGTSATPVTIASTVGSGC
jgi:hypothetical protein